MADPTVARSKKQTNRILNISYVNYNISCVNSKEKYFNIKKLVNHILRIWDFKLEEKVKGFAHKSCYYSMFSVA